MSRSASVSKLKIMMRGGIKMSSVSDYFGSMVFDDKVMRSMLSADVYHSMRKTIDQGDPLNQEIANAVVEAEMRAQERRTPPEEPAL